MVSRLVPLVFLASSALAGGGPANVLVLVNAEDPEAMGVADYYAAAREIPIGHICPISGVDPTARAVSFADYEVFLRAPVEGCLSALPQHEEIDYLVVVRGLPYRVDLPDGGYSTSLSAMLQVLGANRGGEELAGMPQIYEAYHQASVPNPAYVGGSPAPGDFTISNPYANWYATATQIVRRDAQPESFARAQTWSAGGWDFTGNLFIVQRLDGFDYDDAYDLIDRALAADGTFPDAEILCMRGSDDARGARDPECEFVTRMLASAGQTATWLDTFDGALSGREVAAYFTGTADLRGAIDGQSYVPGAIAGNLTSYGAVPNNFFCDATGESCPESESQTSIARFVRAGATGAHGTVAEPLNNTFPGAGTLLHYTLGYSMGESWLFNQRYLYWQNIYVGDPLTTPYAERPVVNIEEVEVPVGTSAVITASHPDGVARVSAYVEGVLVARGDGDRLEVDLSDQPVGATVEILGIAVAERVTVAREGWPIASTTVRSDTQGWSTTRVTIVEAPIDEDPEDDPDDQGGCACSATTSGPALAPLALLLPFARRRRRAGGARAGGARTRSVLGCP